MKRLTQRALQVATFLPVLLAAGAAFAGGSGGGGGGGGGGLVGAPEPAFWTMVAVVAGTETGRRVIKRLRG